MTLTRRAALRVVAAAATVSLAAPARSAESYLLATASTGGVYYPVGVALATLVKVKVEPKLGIGMSAISTRGSGENLRLLRDGKAQFAILEGLHGYWAATGTGEAKGVSGQRGLRAVTMLWPDVAHFVVAAAKARSGTIADFLALRGEAVALGTQDSGALATAGVILGHLGVSVETDYELVFGGYGPAAQALQTGEVSGISTPAGVPVGAITQLFAGAAKSVKLLSFTPEQATQADGGYNLWTPYTIPKGAYPGLDHDVRTIAQPNFLAVNADVPEEHVYEFTKTVYENLGFLQAIHPATKEMSLATALSGLPAPLHPGALRYYREAGIAVPERLIAP